MKFEIKHESRKGVKIVPYWMKKEISEEKLILLNVDVLTPTFLPRDDRNSGTVGYYDRKIGISSNSFNKIKIINSIDEGLLKKKNVYPVITNESIKTLIEIDDVDTLRKWKNKVSSCCYFVNINDKIKKIQYKNDWKKFREPELSTVKAAYFLGCPVVSDSKAFGPSNTDDFERKFNEKWNMEKRFQRYTTQNFARTI